MKKLSLLLVLALLVGCLLPASAQEIPHPYGITYPISGQFGSNHTFTLEQNGTMTIVGKGPMIGNEGYEFPWSVAVGYTMFDFRNHVKRVVVQPGSTTVGENAFAPFYELEEVSLPRGIVSIENGAFTDCKLLEKINLPESLTSIGDGAFGGCEKLTGVRLPANLTYLGGSAFAGTAVTDVKLPAGLTHLGGQAFYDTPWYRAQPDGMIYLNGFAYAYKGDMPENTEITLKPGTKHLCELAFFDHPDTIGQTYQPHLTGLILPDSITELEPYQFENLAGLRRLTLPKGISSLPENMCQECYALEEVTIPDGVTEIGGRAFWECAALEEITIPEGVRTVGEYAFSGCKSLTSVSLPDSVTTLGGGAFNGCEALAEVTLGEGITAIPNGAFKFCPALKEMTLPGSVTEIGPWAFSDCPGLETVRIPVSVKKIGNGAFACSGGGGLKKIIYEGDEAQWRQIAIDKNDNDKLLKAKLYFGGAEPAPAGAIGDVDGDGNITSADARLALRASVRLEKIEKGTARFFAADVDYDRALTAADARLILRASVGLEDLTDRLPESEALTEQELEERINAAVIEFYVQYEEGSGATGNGFAVGEEGEVVVPYGLIRHATSFDVCDGPVANCRVQSVLAVDPVSGLAVLKVSGDIRGLPVSRAGTDLGKPVYSTDYLRSLHRLTTVAAPSDAELPEGAICASVPEGDHSFTLTGYPMVDRFGRAIGFIEQDVYTDEGHFASAIPLSLLPLQKDYDPRSVEAFCRDEWRITPVCPVEKIALVQYGTGLVPLHTPGRWEEAVEVDNPRTDLIDVTVMTAPAEPEYPVLRIFAKKPCDNVPVTVNVVGRYETASLTLTVSASKDGYANMVGAEYLPDPGVLWKTSPSEFIMDGALVFVFMKSDVDLSDEDLFYSYAGALEELGYEYVETEDLGDSYRYRFRFEEAGITVTYTDSEEDVVIACRIDA